jgi:hypothetical protein
VAAIKVTVDDRGVFPNFKHNAGRLTFRFAEDVLEPRRAIVVPSRRA